MASLIDAPMVHVESAAQWREWLAAHPDATGAFAVVWKKHTGRPAPSYDELVTEALAYGWVDSVPKKVDDDRGSRYFSPRKAGSGWSAPNKERVARLEAEGRLTPAGAAMVEAAKADGSWAMLDEVEKGVVPDDLAAALDEAPPARERWEAFPWSVRRGHLEWLVQAKRPATRRTRIIEIADRASRGERANQWPR